MGIRKLSTADEEEGKPLVGGGGGWGGGGWWDFGKERREKWLPVKLTMFGIKPHRKALSLY